MPLDQIEPPNLQLRDKIDPDKLRDLADSMRRRGLIQPIRIRATDGHYTIVAGHRRYLAARSLGWLTIDTIITTEHASTDLATGLHENIFRENLTPIEEAATVVHLAEQDGLDPEAIARALGHTVEWVDGRAALLRFPSPLQEAIHNGSVPLSAAPYLATITNPDHLTTALEAARTHGMTARNAMEWARQFDLYQQAQARGHDVQPPDPALIASEAAQTWCDCCTQKVYINTTKFWRICFDCVQAFASALRPNQ